MDKLAARQRLLAQGAPALADYALQLEQKIADLKAAGCPYPLHSDHFGLLNHRAYIASIPNDKGYPLLVVRCEACGNVTFEDAVPMA